MNKSYIVWRCFTIYIMSNVQSQDWDFPVPLCKTGHPEKSIPSGDGWEFPARAFTIELTHTSAKSAVTSQVIALFDPMTYSWRRCHVSGIGAKRLSAKISSMFNRAKTSADKMLQLTCAYEHILSALTVVVLAPKRLKRLNQSGRGLTLITRSNRTISSSPIFSCSWYLSHHIS